MEKNSLKGIGLQFFAEPAAASSPGVGYGTPGVGQWTFQETMERVGKIPASNMVPEIKPQGAAEPPTPDSSGQQDPQPAPPSEPKPERTFTRDEVNRMIAAERKKAVDEEKARVSEAEKLAKMKDEERLQYEKEQAEQAAAKAIAELNAYKLKDEAVKIARESGLPSELLELLDFHALNAEQVSESIAKLSGVFKKAVETALNEKLGQNAPSGGGSPAESAGRAAGYAQEISKRMQGVI